MSDKNITTDETKLYELGFHIVSSLSETEAEAKFVDLKKNIGNEIVKEGELKNIPLAYTITKKIKGANVRFDNAYFGWVKFNATSEEVEELKKKVDADEDILRFLLIKTIDDDEHSTSKIALEEKKEEESESEDSEKKEKEEEKVEEETEEKKEREMDEAIDEIVKEEE